MSAAQNAREQIRAAVVDAVHEARDTGSTIYAAGEIAADRIVEALDDLFAGVEDMRAAEDAAHGDTGSWIGYVCSARNRTPRGVVALARMLIDHENTPPVLVELAKTAIEPRSTTHVRARSTDPATSKAAAEDVTARRPNRPGGVVHRILDAYDEIARIGVPAGAYNGGATSREVEERFRVREAHKRTSELLRDGLLEVCTVHEEDDGTGRPGICGGSCGVDHPDYVRKGGRVLRITRAGRTELARLNAARAARREAEEARTRRREAREARRRERARVGS